MPAFPRPTPVSLRRSTGFDRFGQAVHGAAETIYVAVVDFSNVATKSPIRSGQSASLGHDQDQVATAKILAAYDAGLLIDDQIILFGINLTVLSVRPRSDVFGNPDHLEVTLARMEQP